jgi:hypothetical protein
MYIIQSFEWATHQPLIKAVMELYAPHFILELGSGIYSTPLFKDSNLLCIENDKDWVELLKHDMNINIIHHDLGDVHDYDLVNDISEKQKKEIRNYYKNLEIPDMRPNLLFVDQVPACRLISINTLRDKFDIIIYHDCDDQGIKLNCYDQINTEGFNSYFLHTNMTGACCMIRKRRDKGMLKETVDVYIKQFMQEWELCTKMYVDSR